MDNRSKIIEGAAGLFRKYGIKAVTMDIIAAHLGISKRTIYEIFADKNELLAGVLEVMARKQKDLVLKVLNESENAISAIFRLIEINLEHFHSMSPGFLDDIKKFHQEYLVKKNEKCPVPDFRNNQEVIERGIKEKLFRKDLDADIVNRTIHYMMLSVMNNDLFPYEEFTRKEVMRNTIINYLKGISTAEGLDIIRKLEKKL
ncbi:MAG: TetR/AcrR family transcriptional regulator [Bacteroidales bacterium]